MSECSFRPEFFLMKKIKSNQIKNFSKKWHPLIFRILFFFNNLLDPEISETLQNLAIIRHEGLIIDLIKSTPTAHIHFSIFPTYKKCSMSSFIGILIQNLIYGKLVCEILGNFFPQNWNWKFLIQIPSDFHLQGLSYTKQINDKERVSAAIENEGIRKTIDTCYWRKRLFI